MEAGTLEQPVGVMHPRAVESDRSPVREQQIIGWLYGITALVLFALMGIGGLMMRFDQANILNISDTLFYRIVTMHGAGMIVTALVAMMGGQWYVLRDTVRLSLPRVLASHALISIGALIVLVSVMIGGFGTGWTFLFPLPFMAAGEWNTWSAMGYFIGFAFVGAGFFIYCFDLVLQVLRRYGGIERSLGISYLRGLDDDPPPPTAIAGLVVGLQGIVTSGAGVAILIAMLQRSVDNNIAINALWAKELTYEYGHTVANLTIYLAAGMLYALLPRYVGRPWKTSKPIVVGWLATIVLVMFAYPHHLYMDFAQPVWVSTIGLVMSSGAAIPVAVVTIYTGMMLVFGSRYRWTLASTLFYLGFAGWAIGGVAAVIDSLIPINFRLHNTLWVPAHFHTYMMLGVMLWAMAFVVYQLERAADRPSSRLAQFSAPISLIMGGYVFLFVWFASGALGVPRRYANHFGGVGAYDAVAAIAASVFAIGVLIVFIECTRLALIARANGGLKLPALALPGGGGGGGGSNSQSAADLRTEPVADAEPGPLLKTRRQLITGIASLTVLLMVFLPAVDDAVSKNPSLHHVQHGGAFLFGMLLTITVCSTVSFGIPRWRHVGSAITMAFLAPALMLVVMSPGIYTHLESNSVLHAGYHLVIIALGVVTGWSLTAFDRFTAWFYFFLAGTMGFIYAAGVGIIS